MTKQTTTPLLSVYGGRQCLGFVLARGSHGFEAFSADPEQSLGVFATRKAAINQLTKTEAPAH
jgi:hypothetical protein